jgi:GxxExxY protein
MVSIEIGFRLDILVEEKLLLNQSVENLSKLHFKQLLTYLKLSLKVGILVNCENITENIKRIVNDFN